MTLKLDQLKQVVDYFEKQGITEISVHSSLMYNGGSLSGKGTDDVSHSFNTSWGFTNQDYKLELVITTRTEVK